MKLAPNETNLWPPWWPFNRSRNRVAFCVHLAGDVRLARKGVWDFSLVHDYSAQFGNWNCLKELITVYNIDPMGIGANDDDFG